MPINKYWRDDMALIAMAVYDTIENRRSSLTHATLRDLAHTVDWSDNRLFIIDNASCKDTQDIYHGWALNERIPLIDTWKLIRLRENVGTAKAINLAWRKRIPGEMCVKMDNDVAIWEEGWIDLMQTVLEKRDDIGIVGLKRKDCEERPDHPNQEWYGSKLKFLPHVPGERWIVIEEVKHVMGTCQGYNSDLLDVIGYLYQLDGLYGFDDALASYRAHIAGWYTVFIPQVEIDHCDPPGENATSPYRVWKQRYSGERMAAYNIEKKRLDDTSNVYYGGDFESYEELIIDETQYEI